MCPRLNKDPQANTLSDGYEPHERDQVAAYFLDSMKRKGVGVMHR